MACARQRPDKALEAEYLLSLVVRLDGPSGEASIASPSHKVSFRTVEDMLIDLTAAGASMDWTTWKSRTPRSPALPAPPRAIRMSP